METFTNVLGVKRYATNLDDISDQEVNETMFYAEEMWNTALEGMFPRALKIIERDSFETPDELAMDDVLLGKTIAQGEKPEEDLRKMKADTLTLVLPTVEERTMKMLQHFILMERFRAIQVLSVLPPVKHIPSLGITLKKEGDLLIPDYSAQKTSEKIRFETIRAVRDFRELADDLLGRCA